MDFPQWLRAEPFTFHDAQRAGLTMHVLRRAVAEGEVRRLLVGVYAHHDCGDSLELRAAAAGLVVPQHAVLCDRTAAWLHGVDVLAFWELELVPPLEMVVLPDLTRVRRAEALGGRRDLLPDDIMEVDGLRVTTPQRTALDLGCKLGRRDAVAALDWFMRRFGITKAALESELPRYRGRRGVVQQRSVVAIAHPGAESPGESWLRICMIDAGLPTPEVQVWVCEDGIEVYRLDLAYGRLKVGAEFDGVESHSSEDQRRHDEHRRAWLRERGWAIVVVRKEDFTKERIEEWTGQLHALVEERRRVHGNPGVRRWRRDLSGSGRTGPQAP